MKKRKGSALMFTIVILQVGIILGFSLLYLIKNDIERSDEFRENYKEIYIAKSGVNATLKYIDNDKTQFRNDFTTSGNNLAFSIQFPGIEGTNDILITDSSFAVGTIEIQSTYRNDTVVYLIRDTGSDYIPIKYLDR